MVITRLCVVITGQTWTVTDLCVYFAPYVFLRIFSVSLVINLFFFLPKKPIRLLQTIDEPTRSSQSHSRKQYIILINAKAEFLKDLKKKSRMKSNFLSFEIIRKCNFTKFFSLLRDNFNKIKLLARCFRTVKKRS